MNHIVAESGFVDEENDFVVGKYDFVVCKYDIVVMESDFLFSYCKIGNMSLVCIVVL